ncbi:hypothetical protein D3C76_1735080 [compost metagenome]
MNLKKGRQLLRTAPGPLEMPGIPARQTQRICQQLSLLIAHTAEVLTAELPRYRPAAKGGQSEGLRLLCTE